MNKTNNYALSTNLLEIGAKICYTTQPPKTGMMKKLLRNNWYL